MANIGLYIGLTVYQSTTLIVIRIFYLFFLFILLSTFRQNWPKVWWFRKVTAALRPNFLYIIISNIVEQVVGQSLTFRVRSLFKSCTLRPWHLFRRYMALCPWEVELRLKTAGLVFQKSSSRHSWPSNVFGWFISFSFSYFYGAYFLGYPFCPTWNTFPVPHSSLVWAVCVSLNVSVYPEAFTSERRRDGGRQAVYQRWRETLWRCDSIWSSAVI